MNYFKVIDKQLYLIAWTLPFNKLTINVVNPAMTFACKFVKVPPQVKATKHIIKGYGGLNVAVEMFEPANASEDLPCLLYLHGGGFCYKALTYHKKWAMAYALEANCKVVFPDYHVAPKFKYPACFEDCFNTYKWILENYEALGIDKNKIGVGGDSAGGALSALIVNACDDRNVTPPCLQMLIYPVADITLSTESMKKHVKAPIWDARASVKMWKYYVPNGVDYSKVSLLHAAVPSKVPKTYIELAEFDCLHDEGLMYAKMLEKSGVDLDLNETNKTFHAYDAMFSTQIASNIRNRRVEFLIQCFSNEVKQIKV